MPVPSTPPGLSASQRRLHREAVAALVLSATLGGLMLACAVARWDVFVPFGDPAASSTAESAVDVIGFVVTFATWLACARWLAMARAVALQTAPGVAQRHGRWAALLGWIWPVANLWVPARMVADVRRASSAPLPPLTVALWWTCWLALTVPTLRLLDPSLSHRLLPTALLASLTVLGAVLWAALVWSITRGLVVGCEVDSGDPQNITVENREVSAKPTRR